MQMPERTKNDYSRTWDTSTDGFEDATDGFCWRALKGAAPPDNLAVEGAVAAVKVLEEMSAPAQS